MSDRSILGLSAFYHDSGAVLLKDGEIIAAAQEERFTRKKHDSSFPAGAAKYVLSEAGKDISDLKYIAFYEKPFLKFERLLETYHALAPRGLKSFMTAMPVWIKEKLFMRKMLLDELKKLGKGGRIPPLLFPEHHLSHAASAFYPSPFEKAAVLTLDGVGEWATATIGKGEGNGLTVLRELNFPHSLGLLYSAFTYYCGFRVNSGEYKLMGLAPYGNPGGDRVKEYTRLILEELVDVREDGSLLLNMDCFDFATGLRMCRDGKWESLFRLPRREPEGKLTQEYCDLACSIQQVTEESIVRLGKTAAGLTGLKNLVMAGGVTLNCVANGKLLRSGIFDNIWIQPAAGDAGGALGAALSAHFLKLSPEVPQKTGGGDSMKGSYLGPGFGETEIRRVIRKYDGRAEKISDFGELCRQAAGRISEGAIVGWFQGRMEWGPRALGNRSILGDPRDPDMQKRLNLKIKYRESFRPFAPSVLSEDRTDYFDLEADSPYMLLVAPVSEKVRKGVPDGYENFKLRDRLYYARSDIPAVTHVDFSARIQTVHRKTNEKYWTLIDAFKKITGCGLLVNTSFNVRGEPIVCTPDDAYTCFMRTDMDMLVMGDFVFEKKDQPGWTEKTDWKETYELD